MCIYEKTEKGISMRNKYHNYDPHPVKKIEGHNSEIWENYDSAAEELRKEAEKRKTKRKAVRRNKQRTALNLQKYET